jgi:dTDP-glucose pyrophosphorylase
MGAKLTVVTRDLEVIFTSDDFEEAVAYYKSQLTGGLFAVHVLDNPDRFKRIRSGVLVVEEKPKRKKDVVVV